MNEFLSADEIAEKLGITRKTFLAKVAKLPNFPPRITITRKAFCWESEKVTEWLKKHTDKKPMLDE